MQEREVEVQKFRRRVEEIESGYSKDFYGLKQEYQDRIDEKI